MDSGHTAQRRSRLRPIVWLLMFLIVVVIVLIAGWLPRRKQQGEINKQAQQRTDELPRVNVQHVERAKSASELMIPGTTLPYAEAYIYARASGYVSRRLVDIGDRVTTGQLLATIDAPDLDRQVDQARSTLDQSQASLVQAQAQLNLASLNWNRYKVLVAKGVFSRQEGDQQEANFRVADANVKAAEKVIDANRENLNRLVVLQQYERVTAPFAGVVTARNVDVGTLINAGGSGLGAGGNGTPPGPTIQGAQGNNQGSSGNLSSNVSPSTGGAQGGQMFSIAAVDRLRVLVSVPEGYAGDIHVGQQALLNFQQRSDTKLQGRVTRTSSSIDQNTRTLLVEVQVQNRYKLVPGMFVVVSFVDMQAARPLVIPGSAIVVREGKPSVAAVAQEEIHFRPISIGRDYGDLTEVTGGLTAGDVIALDITDELEDGTKINPQFPKNQHVASSGARQGQEQPPQGQYGNQQLSESAQKASKAVGGQASKSQGQSKAGNLSQQ